MFEDDLLFNDLSKLDFFRSMFYDLADVDSLADKDEDITKIKTTDRGRGFVLYPSHFKTYALLKSTDPTLATLFIEDLITYGITGQHITRHRVVRALMESIAPVLDNQYAKYLEYRAKDKYNLEYNNHPEDRIHDSFEKLMEDITRDVKI